MKAELVDIIESVINSISPLVEIKSQSTLGNIHTLTVCDPFYAQRGFEVTIGGNPYTITEIDYTLKTIKVEGTSAITVDSFTLYPIQYFHGTPPAVNTELQNVEDAKDKTPLSYLQETFTEKFYQDPEDVYERDSTFFIYFLTQADYVKYQTEDYYQECIKPMRSAADLFLEALSDDSRFDVFDLEYSVTNFLQFGAYVIGKGAPKSLFVDKLSGVGLTITLPIYKDNKCPVC